MAASCLSDEVLDAYLGARLSAEALHELELHVDGCVACRRTVAALLTAPSRDDAPVVSTPPSTEGPLTSSSFTAGQRLGHYEVVSLIGVGGMGEVLLARDLELGRRVALKRLRPGGDDELLREAQLTARFNHPNIVTVYEVFRARGALVLVEEYVEGHSLRQRIEREVPTPPETARLLLAVCEALDEAHRAGVVHCDLKPSNVLVGRDGRVRVVDFGLARLERTSGRAQGTPAYMAPEQWNGVATPASDVWAVGVLLAELTLGTRPFGPDARQLAAPGWQPSQPSEGVARRMLDLAAWCLRLQPSSRPSVEALALELRAVLRDAAPSADARGPFVGLGALGEAHRALYFGREDDLLRVTERLRTNPLVAVVGPSGSGKSSFVRAGLIPRLQERGPLDVLHLRPGASPLQALADLAQVDRRALEAAPARLHAALKRRATERSARVLVVVDQLEELLTHGASPLEQQCFLEALTQVGDRDVTTLRVVVTVREDFAGRLPLSAEALVHWFHLTVLGPAALASIFQRTLAAVGFALEDEQAVLAQLARGLDGQAAPLALLQVIGEQVWQRRLPHQRLITRETWAHAGGLEGALDALGERSLAALPEAAQPHARDVLLRLVATDGTRRRLRRDELLDGLSPGAASALEDLIAHRLVVAFDDGAEGGLELVHETLAQAWVRLRHWLDERAEERSLLRQLESAARLWVARSRPAAEVWRGEALAGARRATTALQGEVSEPVRSFVEAGVRAERRGQRRKVLAAASVMVGLLVMTAAARHQTAQVTQARIEAERARAAAEEGEALAQHEAARAALRDENLREAGARIRTSLELRDTPSARVLALRVIAHPSRWRTTTTGPAFVVRRSPSGRLVAAGDAEDVVLLSPDSGEVLGRLVGHRQPVFTLAFSPDEALLFSGAFDGEICAWHLADGARRWCRRTGGGTVRGLEVVDHGRLLVFGGLGHALHTIRTEDGADAFELGGHGSAVMATAAAEDATVVVTGSRDGEVRRWTVASREGVLVGRLDAEISAVALDGQRGVAVGSVDGTITLLARDGTRRAWKAHTATVNGVAFDGDTLLSVGQDQRVRAWALEDLSLRQQLETGSAVWGLSGTARSLFTAHSGRHVSAWALGRPAPLPEGPGHTAPCNAVAFSPDGARVATSAMDGTVRLWDGEGQPVATLRGHDATVWQVSFDASGQRLVSASEDRTARVWDVGARREQLRLSNHAGSVYGAAFDPDGDRVATACKDGLVRLFSTHTGQLKRTLDAGGGVVRVAFSPSGRTLVAWGSRLSAWALPSGAVVRTVDDDSIKAATVLDDDTVLVGSARGLETLSLRSGVRTVKLTEPSVVSLAGGAGGLAMAAEDGQLWWGPGIGGPWQRARLESPVSDVALDPPRARVAVVVGRRLAIGPPFAASARPALPSPASIAGHAIGRSALGELLVDARVLAESPRGDLLGWLSGPGVVVGVWASGEVGVWDLATGQRLHQMNLNGLPRAIEVTDGVLHFDDVALDLRPLEQERCAFLRALRAELPFGWEGGALARDVRLVQCASP